MDPQLLDYYSQELLYMRGLAAEFARAHPKIARRLGMQAGEIEDAYVSRLVESASLVNARMQRKLADEFPQLFQPLLACAYPDYLSPTPAIGVARFYPGGKAGDLTEGYLVTRGTAADSNLSEGEKTACQFRTSQDVTLYPLTVSAGRLSGVPPDIHGLDRHVPPHRRVRGSLRLRLRTTEDIPFSRLQGLDRLPLYLAGDEKIASHLHELIHTTAIASVVGEPGRFGESGYDFHVVTANAVIQEGLGADESVLPLVSKQFLGHNQVHEYFACPSRFYFFTLTGLQAGLKRIDGCEAEIVVLLDKPTAELADHVNAFTFAPFCTPVVNLFPMRTDSVKIAPDAHEILLTPVEKFPLNYEVYTVDAALGQVNEESEPLTFHPLDTAFVNDEGAEGRYFTLRREQHQSLVKSRQYTTHRPYVATSTFLSLTGPDREPYDGGDGEAIRFLSLDVWLTNRELPSLLRCDGVRDLRLRQSAPITSIGFVRAPAPSRPPLAQDLNAWHLLAQLDLDLSVFDDEIDEPHPGEGLRMILQLYSDNGTRALRRQVDSLVGARLTPVNRIVAGQQPPMARVMECDLTFDESGFDGVSPYALGLVLERYLARHVSTLSFTSTVLRSTQRGRIAAWPPRSGTRSVI
jgi:type VI secretion system protein ImpG